MLEEYFGELEDDRQQGKVQHSLNEILTIVLCAVSAEITTIHGIRDFARIKESWFRQKAGLELPNGLPSYDTLRRVLGIINPKQFQNLFIRWIENVLEMPEGTYLSIDGKTLKGSGNEQVAPLHMLSAYCHEAGVVLGQMNCAEKDNEITVCPQLLDSLKIHGAVITTDAMMCQKKIAQKIAAKKCDYVLALKKNHPTMHREVEELFECGREERTQQSETFDVGHGRIERRKYTLDTDVSWFADRKEWKNLKAFGKCESSRTVKGKTKTQTRYFVTSVTDVSVFSKAVRTHWSIENNLHWVLDVMFSDDECPVLDKNIAENLAIIRRIVYNRIKMLSQFKTLSMGRRSCMFDDDFRLRILFARNPVHA